MRLTDTHLEAELAGLTRSDDDGRLGAPLIFQSPSSVPARLELADGHLQWWWWHPDRPEDGGREQASRGALDEFIAIKSDRDVLRFAGKFGVLGICSHDVPASHNPPPPMAAFAGWQGPLTWCRPIGWEEDLVREPIVVWLHFAQQAAAIVRVAAAVRRKERAKSADWATIFSQSAHPTFDTDDLEVARIMLAGLVKEWLAIGNVRPKFTWWSRADQPSFALGGETFATLAAQLMLAVSGSQSVAVCSGCSTTYFRKERAPQGPTNWCPACRGRVAARERKRRSRAKSPVDSQTDSQRGG